MTSEETAIVADSTLLSALAAASRARDQCLEILNVLESYSSDPSKDPTPISQSVETQISTQTRQVSGELGKVRALHRKALQGAREEKAKTANARHEVDILHLQLQNLYYEQRHLTGEINACESYEYASPSSILYSSNC
jgi:THO complex subunit 5